MRLRAELDWLCQAPDLLQPPPQFRVPDALRQPSPYQPCLTDPALPSWRLGRHFEDIVFQHLNYNTYVTDIKRNIQIKNQQQTLGELDFLICMAQQWVHLEVAVKLYLLDGPGAELSDFVGTRRDDCLATKWRRMLEHQLALGAHPAARKALAQMGISQRPQAALWIKGWLFYPFGTQLQTFPTPINPWHQRGWWLTQSRLGQLAGHASHFLLPGKTDWLLPADLMHSPLFDLAGLQQQLRGTSRANLVVAIEHNPQGVLEISRGFVVTDDWPEAGP